MNRLRPSRPFLESRNPRNIAKRRAILREIGALGVGHFCREDLAARLRRQGDCVSRATDGRRLEGGLLLDLSGRKAVWGAFLLGLVLPLGRISHPSPAATETRARYLMGTVFRFEAPAGRDPKRVGESLEAALDEVERLESLLSNWRDDSELSLLNARPGRGAIRVGPELFAVLEASLRWARLTQGAFDPALEPLTRALRGSPEPAGPPSPALVSPAPPLVFGRGWNRVRLDSRNRSVSLPQGAGLDLGGIGKGFALDRAAQVLGERGIRAALLDAGGQILAVGSPPGEPGWRIAVADPQDRGRPALELVLRDVSAATSGNSEHPGEILDPATGSPLAGSFSATALAAEGTAADALSTALFVMGPAGGEAWARKRNDVLAVYLEPGNRPGDPLRMSGTLSFPPRGGFLLISARGSGHRRSVHAEIHRVSLRRDAGAGSPGEGAPGESGRGATLPGSFSP